MAKVIGLTFGDELIAAGLGGIPVSWGSDGNIFGLEKLTTDKQAAFNKILAAHNPAATMSLITRAKDLHNQSINKVLNDTIAAIAAGTITTNAQVDAKFA